MDYTENLDVDIFDRIIPTVLTNSEDRVNEWIRDILHYPNCAPRRHLVGLDIEVPNPDHPNPPVAAIQLCFDRRCLIYHTINATRLPETLRQLIVDPHIVVFGVSLVHKLSILQRQTGHTGRVTYVDVSYLAAHCLNRPELQEQAGMSELSLAVLEEELEMPVAEPDWDRPVLSDGQVKHAAIGAYLSYEMAARLLVNFNGN